MPRLGEELSARARFRRKSCRMPHRARLRYAARGQHVGSVRRPLTEAVQSALTGCVHSGRRSTTSSPSPAPCLRCSRKDEVDRRIGVDALRLHRCQPLAQREADAHQQVEVDGRIRVVAGPGSATVHPPHRAAAHHAADAAAVVVAVEAVARGGSRIAATGRGLRVTVAAGRQVLRRTIPRDHLTPRHEAGESMAGAAVAGRGRQRAAVRTRIRKHHRHAGRRATASAMAGGRMVGNLRNPLSAARKFARCEGWRRVRDSNPR